MTQYTQHPLSAAFPALADDEFQALKDSIEDLGVQNPITVYEGQVLDGWNRYRAACELGMECPEQKLAEWMDPRAFVKAQNKARRHLSTGAWALIEVRLRDWKPIGANQHGGSAPGAEAHQTGCAPGAHPPAQSISAVSEETGYSVRTLNQAKAVNSKALPEVQEAVMANKVSLKTADQIARLPAEKQPEALEEAQAPRPKKTAPVKAPSTEIGGDGAPPGREDVVQNRVEELEAELGHARQLLKEAQDDLSQYIRIVEQSDPLAEAVQLAAEQRKLAQGLQTRIDSLMNEVAELKRSVKHWQRKAEKAGQAA